MPHGFNWPTDTIKLKRLWTRVFILHTETLGYNILSLMETGSLLNPSRPNPRQREKNYLDFHFHTSLWSSKGFMKALKAFIKPFAAPQRSAKIKFKLIFILTQISSMYSTGSVNTMLTDQVRLFNKMCCWHAVKW